MNFKSFFLISSFFLMSSAGATSLNSDINTAKEIFSIGSKIYHNSQGNVPNGPQNVNNNQTSNSASRTPGTCPQHYPLGAPVVTIDTEKVNRRAFYTCESNYATMLDAQTKTPLWSVEVLQGNSQAGTKVERKDAFQPNPNVPKQVQASLNDYRGSGFDRGHMAPAADMLTDQGMFESFFMTNMVPQVGPNMNRGIWADLEAMVRKWSVARGEVHVVTGPIFEGQVAAIGTTQVWVPTSIYKVVLDPRTLESIAFIIPNRQIVTRKTKTMDNGNASFPQTQPEYAVNCNSRCQLDDFIVSTKDVETKSGLYFFPNVNPANRNNIYKTSRMWHAK